MTDSILKTQRSAKLNGSKPRILAITHDNFAIRQLRLEMPLSNLRHQGLIEGYSITDESFTHLPDDVPFDVVWLQRIENRRLIEQVISCVGGSFMYDIDDLLIGRPSYTRMSYNPSVAIQSAIENCRVVCVTSNRLIGLLEKYTNISLKDKCVICPNGFEFSSLVRKPQRPEGLIWTSSDFAALIASRDIVVRAISKFSEKYNLPIYCFGYLDQDIKARLKYSVDMGLVSFWHHKALLASLPVLIGVAPLETVASKQDLDFIAGKSDLKMVEFAGFGHPSVYSLAPPYVDTDIRAGVIVDNDQDSWADGLTRAYEDYWKRLDLEQNEIVRKRHMNEIVSNCWFKAINNVRLQHPLKGKDIKYTRTTASMSPYEKLLIRARNSLTGKSCAQNVLRVISRSIDKILVEKS